MKAFNTVMKILAALAAVAGTVYVIATYGDRIVAWAKKMLESLPCNRCCFADEDVAEDDFADEAPAAEEPVEEAAAEAPAEEPAEEPAEAPAEEVAEEPVDETAPVADDADFEG